MLFPGSGFVREAGSGAGTGFSVNLPLPPEADDEIVVHGFTGVVPPLIDAFKPDIIVSQLGVDTFLSDPLAHLNVTTNGFSEMVRTIRSFSVKWLALGGGGYDITNVARAWTLAWAIMNDTDAPDAIPGDFLSRYTGAGFLNNRLRDEIFVLTGKKKEGMRVQVENTIRQIKEQALRSI
jgi:acetoin utilization protein AcuC